jgi:uncharacterized coiled-coil protein SlyX
MLEESLTGGIAMSDELNLETISRDLAALTSRVAEMQRDMTRLRENVSELRQNMSQMRKDMALANTVFDEHDRMIASICRKLGTAPRKPRTKPSGGPAGPNPRQAASVPIHDIVDEPAEKAWRKLASGHSRLVSG